MLLFHKNGSTFELKKVDHFTLASESSLALGLIQWCIEFLVELSFELLVATSKQTLPNNYEDVFIQMFEAKCLKSNLGKLF